MEASKSVIAFALVSGLFLGATSHAQVASQIRDLTGARARIVWQRQVTDSTGGYAADNILMGIDTDSGSGERVICSTISSYKQPRITPNGDRVVFTRSIPTVCTDVCVINWDGTGLRKITPGSAPDVWKDPKTGIEWVYVVKPNWLEDALYRYQIDDTTKREIVWPKSGARVASIWFKVSPDGKRAAGGIPWPKISVLRMVDGANATMLYDSIGKGCHADIAPDNSYHVMHKYSHMTYDMYDSTGKQIADGVVLNDLPGFQQVGPGGWSLYHLAWSNRRRLFTHTGPYPKGVNADKDHSKAELYIREFNPTLTDVTSSFVRVTNNDLPDRYGHLWVKPGPAAPTFFLSTGTLHFAGLQGGADPAGQVVTATAEGGLSLAGLTATPNATWLKVTITGSGSSRTLTNQITLGSTPAGSYSATVTVVAGGVTKTYGVNLTVAGAGIAALSTLPVGSMPVITAQDFASGKVVFRVRPWAGGPFVFAVHDPGGARVWSCTALCSDRRSRYVEWNRSRKTAGIYFAVFEQGNLRESQRFAVP